MFRFLLSPIVLAAVLQQTPTVLPNAPSPSISLNAAEPTDKVPSAISDKVAHVGGSIKAPVLIYSVSPGYTERVAKKRLNGNVEVYLWVDENGNPTHVRVVKGVGMGLDEKAVEAVQQYRLNQRCRMGSR